MRVRALLAACGGFLAAVVWMDLMFDVQALRADAGPLSPAALASIAAYYRRVTTDAYPMGRLIAFVMLVAITGAVWGVARRERRALDWVALVLAAGPIGLAGARVLPNAIRLGSDIDTLDAKSALARLIARDHVLCFLGIAAFAVTQVLMAGRARRD